MDGDLYATGTTGALLAAGARAANRPILRAGRSVVTSKSARRLLTGDSILSSLFWDPLEPQPHDVDVKTLLRIAVVYNVPIACNRSTADFLLSSPLMRKTYERRITVRQLPFRTRDELQAV